MGKNNKNKILILLVGLMSFMLLSCGEKKAVEDKTIDKEGIISDIVDTNPLVTVKLGEELHYIDFNEERDNLIITKEEDLENSKKEYYFTYKKNDAILDLSYDFKLLGEINEDKFILDSEKENNISNLKVKIKEKLKKEDLSEDIYTYLNVMEPQAIGAYEKEFLPIASKENTEVNINNIEYKETKNQQQLLIGIDYNHRDEEVLSKGNFTLAIIKEENSFPKILSLADDFNVSEEKIMKEFTIQDVRDAIEKKSKIVIPGYTDTVKRELTDNEWESIDISSLSLEGRKGTALGKILIDGERRARELRVDFTVIRDINEGKYIVVIEPCGLSLI